MQLFAGLDGGASRTRVRVIDQAGRLVGQGLAGPGSLTAGAEGAAGNARAALVEALSGDAARLQEVILVAGLAGHRQLERRARFENGMAAVGRLEVISDGYAALLGAHRGQPGAIVIVGTGSVALRLEPDGRCRQAGGWGPVAGDEGSGNWLGRAAVRAALRAADEAALEGGPDRDFLARLRQLVGGEHEPILDWVAAADPARFASLAPLVLEHADRGDPAAGQLVGRAVAEIERLIRLIGARGRVPVALMGGLAAAFEPRLGPAVRRWLVAPAGDAVEGALLRARGLAPLETYA